MNQERSAGDRERIISRMRKILALAESGQGGERDNAQAMLNRMLKKHGITMDELTSPDMKIERRHYTYRSAQEKMLLGQVIIHILQSSDPGIWSRRGVRALRADTTMGQDAQIRLIFSILKRSLKVEQDRTLRAFIHRHELFGQSSGQPRELSDAEIMEARAIQARMAVMDRTQIRPALPKAAH